MHDSLTRGKVVLGCLLVVLSLSGPVAASGTTDVMLSPETEHVEPGESVSYDVVVLEADGGVGSFNATFSTNDSDVASVADVSYANSPDYAHRPSGGGEARLAASGMETLDTGNVRVAMVTVETADAGAVRFSLSVSALGDENGESYVVADTRGRTLIVESEETATPTPTETETEREDDDSSSSDDDDSDSDESADGDSDDSSADQTATDAGGDEETTDANETTSPTATATATQTQAAGGATTPTETGASSSTPVSLLLAGVVVVLALAGAVFYYR